MKLLIFSTEFPPGPGGIGTHAWQLARFMKNFGWQVKVLTLQDYAGQDEIIKFNHQQTFDVHTLKHQHLPILELVYRRRALTRLIRNWHPDLLIASGEQAVLVSASIRRAMPSIAIWHGVISPVHWRLWLYRWAYQQMDRIVAVSYYSSTMIQAMGVQPQQVRVIPNGADAEHFKPISEEQIRRFRQEISLPHQPLLLTVGNVSERKGQDIVIKALPSILADFPEIHYLIAGLPTRQEALRNLTHQLGVSSQVHFLGRVEQEQLPVLYNACDLFVLTSRHSSDGEFEGYGIVVVEAALCGKPSVVTNNSGLVEAIQVGETGLIVPENDPQATAEAIGALLTDPEQLARMGQAARARALQEQTWEICMSRYDAAFHQWAGFGEHPAMK